MSKMPIVNAKGPHPISWDGTKARKCDRYGNPDLRGRCIFWYEKDANGLEIKKLARLQYPERKQPPINLDAVKDELKKNPRLNMRLPKSRARMRARLINVYGRLGVQHTDALNITHISDKVDTACWGTGEKETDEFILVNPYFVDQRKTFLALILQHEIMHRALYRGRRRMKDRQLLNVVLDACIHRVLASSPNGKPAKTWNRFCEWLYPDESKKTVLAICNASLNERELRELARINPKYVEIWHELYGKFGEDDTEEVVNPRTGKKRKRSLKGTYKRGIARVNPDDLYFRLKDQLNDADRKAMAAFDIDGDGSGNSRDGMNPFGGCGDEVMLNGKTILLRDEAPDIGSEAARRVEDAIRRSLVPKRLRRTMSWKTYSDCRTEFWDKFVKKPEDLYNEDLADYARRIHTDKILDDVAGHIKRKFIIDVVPKPYAEVLTEEGLIMACMGFRPPKWPLLNNYDGKTGRKRIVAFFDVSPSTYYFWPYMMRMIETFEQDFDLVMARNDYGESGALLFAGSVHPLSRAELEDMKRGKIQTGATTHFDSVVEYANEQIRTDDVDAVVVFTDGESGLKPELVDEFNGSGKQCYRIYFVGETPTLRGSGYKMNSALDELNGESFTLIVPKSDHLDWNA
jgi:hypothetical protein